MRDNFTSQRPRAFSSFSFYWRETSSYFRRRFVPFFFLFFLVGGEVLFPFRRGFSWETMKKSSPFLGAAFPSPFYGERRATPFSFFLRVGECGGSLLSARILGSLGCWTNGGAGVCLSMRRGRGEGFLFFFFVPRVEGVVLDFILWGNRGMRELFLL